MERFTDPADDACRINLDDYIPSSTNYNTVVYVHKKFYNPKETKKEKTKNNKKELKNKHIKEDKAVSCKIQHDEPLINHTIKFAKDLTPFIIPLSEDNDVVYTVKACNKHRRKENSSPDSRHDRRDIKIDKKARKVIETYRKEKTCRDSVSGSSQSPNNTLDDFNMNNSLTCTFSNTSDNKPKAGHKRKTRDPQKFTMSESFEGLAEINEIGEATIKLQLMSEKEKEFLVESLRNPIIDSIQDCVSKFNSAGMKEEIKSVQRTLRNNSVKLDNILERLECIETYLARKTRTPKVKTPRSRLELLGEDLREKVDSSEGEMPKMDTNRQYERDCDVVENFGGGEVATPNATTSVGVRTEKLNRLPARFCWTSTDAKMV